MSGALYGGADAETIRPADTNCDGLVNDFNIDPFLMALMTPDAYRVTFPDCDLLSADCNGDGLVNFFDVDSFLACLFGGGCP